ncbi:hypothetical protein DRO91_05040 [Candidatus Heimdallarchaeota archaeon]|nr:MAG: hypothetical protein DRO63_06595 [Candidatus Gerdarchaeota archaeon]RLI71946.1 MAG: hypothetical protein DRO91_05040 [Candidatus Heimdallarchaeota archaeon]RLI72334.1 MAG: hypothetical protein DRP02_02130 [Candidatus Gerdarchaeota archaeon]
MQKLLLLTKVHSTDRGSFKRIQAELEDRLKDLTVIIQTINIYDNGFIALTLEGEDEIAAKNYLSKLYGKAIPLEELKVGDTLKGFICSSGKVGFGLFVDIGIKEPYAVDALIPLYALREQLVEGRKFSTRQLIELFGLVNDYPLEITIQKVSIGLKKIEAQLSEKQVELFRKWQEEGLERLLIIGERRDRIINALEKTNHQKDIIEIEQLGWSEYALTCKFNTTAKGLIPEIGKILPHAKFEIFSPAKIRKQLKAKSS